MAPIAQDDHASYRSSINASLYDKDVSEISISEYIFSRIAQLGITSIFGVPGDFNLNLLEHIYDVHQVKWVGCCNELNAAYAAQAYSKVSHGLSVLITTYGVGELSAINGIGGAYAEYNPVLHIVGTSAMSKKKFQGKIVNPHHLIGAPNTLQFPDHYVYEKMAESVSVTCQSVTSVEDACDKIDRAIEITYAKSRPGYLFLPCDLADVKVPVERLYTPLNMEYQIVNRSRAQDVATRIIELLYQSKNPALVGDYFTFNFRMEKEFQTILEKTKDKFNLYDTFMGKGLINENLPRFMGTYWGNNGSRKNTHIYLGDSDCIFVIGTCNTETNNGLYVGEIPKENVIEMNQDFIRIYDEIITDVNMMDVLPIIAEQLDSSKLPVAKVYEDVPRVLLAPFPAPLSARNVFDSLQSMLRPNDVVIIETSAFMFASQDLVLDGAKMIAQHCYNSIGFALPATLGACLALKDNNLPGRVITMEGDGSSQMTIQELATIMRNNLTPIFFLMNNDGYTIERVIKGATSSYNDIAPNWQWTELLRVFGDVSGKKSSSNKIQTGESLNELVHSKQIQNPTKLEFIELVLDRMDSNDRIKTSLGGK